VAAVAAAVANPTNARLWAAMQLGERLHQASKARFRLNAKTNKYVKRMRDSVRSSGACGGLAAVTSTAEGPTELVEK
jgi:hypothetical protein